MKHHKAVWKIRLNVLSDSSIFIRLPFVRPLPLPVSFGRQLVSNRLIKPIISDKVLSPFQRTLKYLSTLWRHRTHSKSQQNRMDRHGLCPITNLRTVKIESKSQQHSEIIQVTIAYNKSKNSKNRKQITTDGAFICFSSPL
jgi:hypothetical protein